MLQRHFQGSIPYSLGVHEQALTRGTLGPLAADVDKDRAARTIGIRIDVITLPPINWLLRNRPVPKFEN